MPSLDTDPAKKIKLRNDLDEMLTNWRKVLPSQLQWSDLDDPSPDINEARLRAKFYGAKYIIHRPFLRMALDGEVENPGTGPEKAGARKESGSSLLSYLPTPIENSGNAMAPPIGVVEKSAQANILQSAESCVGAAMRSTTAFDNIINHRRLIVTNIFGTSHA